MMSVSASDTPHPITGLRVWSERDDEPGADVAAGHPGSSAGLPPSSEK